MKGVALRIGIHVIVGCQRVVSLVPVGFFTVLARFGRVVRESLAEVPLLARRTVLDRFGVRIHLGREFPLQCLRLRVVGNVESLKIHVATLVNDFLHQFSKRRRRFRLWWLPWW